MITEYPEHEKLKQVSDKSQAIGEFLEWMRAQGYVIARFGECDLYAAREPITRLLADYFGIDEGKLEEEKQAMIDEIRKGK